MFYVVFIISIYLIVLILGIIKLKWFTYKDKYSQQKFNFRQELTLMSLWPVLLIGFICIYIKIKMLDEEVYYD